MQREAVDAKHNLPARRIFAIVNAGKRGLRDAAFAIMKDQQPHERFRKKFPELPVMPVQ